MKKTVLSVLENTSLTNNLYKAVLSYKGETLLPGQFLELKITGCFLNRPFCIADYDGEKITILYCVVGIGTDIMSKMKEGESLTALLPLGNGFDITKSKKPLLIGGGSGIAALLYLAKSFEKIGIKPEIILGFRTKDEAFCVEDFKSLGYLTVCTDDGSLGYKGFPSDILKSGKISFDKYYACGPSVMLKSITAISQNGYVSLEAKMGCGFGACMGCSVNTKSGVKRVCKDGPVFDASEVYFD